MAASFLVPAAISIASEFFPVLATKLGGQRGRRIAEQVIEVSATVAGTPKNAGPREIIAALKEDDAKAAEVRLRLEELDQQEHQRIVDDRADARRYQAQVGVRGRLRGTLMLVGVVIGLVVCIVGVFRGTDPAALALLTTIAGALLKMLSDAFAFEFGSSSGSKEKDAHIEKMQRTLMEATRPAAHPDDRHHPLRASAQAVADAPPPPAEAPEETDVSAAGTSRLVVRAETGSGGKRDFVAELVALST